MRSKVSYLIRSMYYNVFLLVCLLVAMKHAKKITITTGAIVVCMFILAFGVVEAWSPTFVSIMLTTSMEPDIEAGDIFTVVRTVPFHEVNVGDVVVYWRNHNRIAHEVVNRTDDGLFTKGHNPPWAEAEYVTRDQYVGIVGDVYEICAFNVILDHVPLDALLPFPNNILLAAIVALSVVFILTYKHKRKR